MRYNVPPMFKRSDSCAEANAGGPLVYAVPAVVPFVLPAPLMTIAGSVPSPLKVTMPPSKDVVPTASDVVAINAVPAVTDPTAETLPVKVTVPAG
jgi:hypothetical protein